MQSTNQSKPIFTLNSLADISRHMSIALGAEYGYKNGYFFSESFPELDWHNRVILNEVGDNYQPLIDEAIDLSTHTGHPKFLTFCDELVPAEVPSYLESKNMSLLRTLTGMLYYPTEKDAFFHDDRIIEITEDRIDEWDTVVHTAFGRTDDYQTGRSLLKDEEIRFFAIEEDGIASTIMVCLDGNKENAGIHNVGTLPAYRGKGYAESLVRHVIALAYKEGFPMLSLQASDLGKPVYERIGFRKESTIRMYHSIAPSKQR